MKVVGFDTATDDTVVAATNGDQVAFEQVMPPDGRPVHSQSLLELVSRAAESLGGWDQVERIAVGVGPGTFTGIRIGVATGAGLAASTGIEIVGVSSLAALARSIGDHGNGPVVMALIDARRGEVFGGLHDGEGRALGEPFVCGPEALIEKLDQAGSDAASPICAGPGAVRFRDELLQAGFEIEPAESAVHQLAGAPICQLGATAEKTGTKTLEPLYLRVPDAQLWLERDGNATSPH